MNIKIQDEHNKSPPDPDKEHEPMPVMPESREKLEFGPPEKPDDDRRRHGQKASEKSALPRAGGH